MNPNREIAMNAMKRVFLMAALWPVCAFAQNIGDVGVAPGGCAVWGSKAIRIYRLPDTTNIYRSPTSDIQGFYEAYLPHPGQYRVKTAGQASVWIGRINHTPYVPIGGDSTSNAGRLIQNALDSLPSTGGIIHLPPGTHLIDSNTVTVNKSNVTVRGTGETCVLKAANSFNKTIFTVANNTSGILFENFVLNGNKANQTAGGGININGADISDVKIQNIHFRHNYEWGVAFANGVDDADVFSCIFDSIGIAGETSVLKGFPIWCLTSNTNHRYSGNVFTWWSGTAAIRINNNCRRIAISGNILISNDKTGTADRRAIFADSGAAGRCEYLSFTDNKIFDIDENGIFSNFNNFTVISGNQIDTTGNNGIEANDDYAQIDNNNVFRGGGHGITVNNSIGTSATNNKVRQSAKRGIYFFASNGDSVIGSVISNNTVWNSSQSSATADAGIEVQGEAATGQLRNTTLTGNSCFDLQGTKTQTYGISVSASAGKSDILLIVGNNVGRNLTGGINDGSDGVNETIASNQTTP